MKILYSKEEISNRVKEIGKKISEDFYGNDIVIAPILKGAVMFSSDLIREIILPLRVDFLTVSSYHGTESSGQLKIKYLGDLDWSYKNVILVEDIIDTGFTLSTVIDYLYKIKKPKTIKICTLIDKYSRRKINVKADYVGFTLNEDHFVVGYGLDDDEYDRNLDSICIMGDIHD